MALEDERKRKRERKKYFKQCYLWWNWLKKLSENTFFFSVGNTIMAESFVKLLERFLSLRLSIPAFFLTCR